MRFSPRGRLALTIVLAVYGFRMLTHPEVGWFLDNVDLPIHETGHLVFSPFGEFMQFAGGTLFQLLLPAVFVGYFFRQKDRHGASIALWWVAQNLWNVSSGPVRWTRYTDSNLSSTAGTSSAVTDC